MKYFGVTDQTKHMTDPDLLPMAKGYWGPQALPAGAEIVGGYSDEHRAGALIRLINGMLVCGNAGVITTIEQPKRLRGKPLGSLKKNARRVDTKIRWTEKEIDTVRAGALRVGEDVSSFVRAAALDRCRKI